MSRFRTRDNLVPLAGPFTGTKKNFACTNTAVTETLGFTYLTGSYESFSDTEVPNFHRRSEAGEVFVNPMMKTKQEIACSIGARSYHVPKVAGESCTYTENISKSPLALNLRGTPMLHVNLGLDRDRLAVLAGTQAAANIDDPSFEGAVFIAELSETLSFLSNPLKNWNSFLRDVRKRKNRSSYERARTVFDHVSREWLSYRYAVRPLVMDIQDAVTAVKSKLDNGVPPKRKTARGKASISGSKAQTDYRSVSGDAVFQYDRHTSGSIEARAGVLYELSHGADTFGVYLADVPGAIWEAVKWSFIADWIANIGPFIKAITPKQGVKELCSWTVITEEYRTDGTCKWTEGGTFLPGRARIIDSEGRCEESLYTYQKQRRAGIQVGLSLQTAPLGGLRGVARITDLLAIGHGLLKSR